MQGPFDPYAEWLGLPAGWRPGNHYELLGLNPEEQDLGAIAHAADVLMAKVRRVRPGAHLAEWQRLLDQIKTVKACLLDPGAKASYDAILRAPRQAAPASPVSGPLQPMDQAAAAPGGMSPAEPVQAGPAQPPPSVFADVPPPAWGSYAPGLDQPPAVPPVPANVPPLGPQPGFGAPSGLAGVPAAIPAGGPAPPPFPVGTAVPAGSPMTAPIAAAIPVSGAGPIPGSTPPVGTAIPASDAIPAGSEPVWQDAIASRQPPRARAAPGRAKKDNSALIQWGMRLLTLVLAVVATVLAVIVYQQREELMARFGRDRTQAGAQSPAPGAPPPAADPHQRKRPDKPVQAVAKPEQPEQGAQPKPPEPPKPPQPPKPDDHPKPPQPAAGGEKSAAFRQKAADTRFAMSEHDLEAARRHLNEAKAIAQTPAEQAEAERLETLLANLEEFWKLMSQVVARLDGGEEIAVADTRVAVVESGPDYLIIRAQGRNRRYELREIPPVLVRVLAEQRFSKETGSQVLYGCYLAVDPEGDRARARQLWETAGSQGADVKDLMPELDEAPPQAPSTPGAGPKVAPPSDQAAIQQAEQAVKAMFQAEYAAATIPMKKAELASKLLASARKPQDSGDARFVMLREAESLAAASGDPQTACAAIDEIAQSYTVDTLAMKTAALEQAVQSARALSAFQHIAMTALTLIPQAVEATRMEEASRLATTAVTAAQKAKSAPLLQQARTVAQQVEVLRKQAEGAKKEG